MCKWPQLQLPNGRPAGRGRACRHQANDDARGRVPEVRIRVLPRRVNVLCQESAVNRIIQCIWAALLEIANTGSEMGFVHFLLTN